MTEDATDFLEGQVNRYKLTGRRPFAYGRISVLYKGVDFDRNPVCLKLFKEMPMSPEVEIGEPAEFFSELGAQQRLQHRNILQILDYGRGTEEDPGPFIAYPFCKGGSLRSLMTGRTYVPLTEAVPILTQIATAIDFAHNNGFIHGDIKPENILFLEAASHVLLSDFGMSRHFPITEHVSSVRRYPIAGASAYLSPEELERGDQSIRSDIYSFGVVAYELLTGSLPFDMSVPLYTQMHAKISGNLIDPRKANPSLPVTVGLALECALQADPHYRPHSAEHLCHMLAGEQVFEVKKPDINQRLINYYETRGIEWKTYDKGRDPSVSADATGVAGQEPAIEEGREAQSQDEERAVQSIEKVARDRFWHSLDPKTKAGVVSGIIAAIAGVVAALIKILPSIGN